MAGSIKILWDRSTAAAVSITSTAGGQAGTFTVNGSPVTFPYSLTDDKTFVTTTNDRFSVSVKLNSVEIAGKPDAPLVVDLSNGGDLILAPSPDDGFAAPASLAEKVDIEAVPATLDRAGLAAADTLASTTKFLTLKSGVYNVATNLTISAHVTFRPGAIIKPANGVVVTLSGGITAQRSQIFDHSSGGIVVPKKTDYHPAWWGALGTADDTAVWNYMQQSITSGLASGVVAAVLGQRVVAPSGLNRINGVSLNHVDFVASAANVQFAPPAAATTGTMLTFGDFSTVRGGYYVATGSQAVTLIAYTGYRSSMDGLYVVPQATNSLGILIDNGGSHSTITPYISNTLIVGGLHGANAASAGKGMTIYSSDGKFSNLTIGECSVGIDFQRGAARFSNLHVWGCGTGMTGGPDGSTVSNGYIETNLGWGVDFTNADRCVFDGCYVWGNGATTSSTGGIRLLQSGGSSCRDNIITGCVFDDNVGIGLKIEGIVSGTEVRASRFGSLSTQGGGAALCDTAVQIGATATGTRLDIRARAADHLTAVIDDLSGAAATDLGSFHKILAADLLHTQSNTTSVNVLSVSVSAKEKWLVEGVLVFDSSQAADYRARLQATGHTGVSGYLTSPVLTGNSQTSLTASSIQMVTAVAIASSGGGYLNTGAGGVGSLMALHFKGYVTSTGSSGTTTLDLMAGPQNSDATQTTTHAGSWMTAKRIG